MATQSRIYRVDESSEGALVASFLIRAPNVAQAVRFIAQRFTADVASQDDLVELAGKGVKVQDADGDQS
jgi:hypothetical protein